MRGSLLTLLLFACCASLATAQWSTQCNVKSYGAVGDGIVDDSAAVSKAMQYCLGIAEQGPTAALIYFPVGIYKVQANESLSGYASFFYQDCYDQPAGTISFQGEVDASGNRARLLWVTDTDTNSLFSSNMCPGVSITSIDVDVEVACCGINVEIAQFQGHNGTTISDVNWRMATDSSQAYGTAASFEDASGIRIENSVFQNVSLGGIFFQNCTDVSVSHVQVYSTPSEFPAAVIEADGGGRYQFDNLLLNSSQVGIHLSIGQVPMSSAVVTISDVTFTNQQYAGVSVDDTVNLSVTGSTFTCTIPGCAGSNTTNGVVIVPISSYASPVATISGCTFSGLTGSGISSVKPTGPVGAKTSMKGSNDRRLPSKDRSVQVTDSSPLTVQNCAFDNNSMDLTWSGNGWQLVGNTCQGNDNSQLHCSDSGCVVSNNQGCNFKPATSSLKQKHKQHPHHRHSHH